MGANPVKKVSPPPRPAESGALEHERARSSEQLPKPSLEAMRNELSQPLTEALAASRKAVAANNKHRRRATQAFVGSLVAVLLNIAFLTTMGAPFTGWVRRAPRARSPDAFAIASKASAPGAVSTTEKTGSPARPSTGAAMTGESQQADRPTPTTVPEGADHDAPADQPPGNAPEADALPPGPPANSRSGPPTTDEPDKWIVWIYVTEGTFLLLVITIIVLRSQEFEQDAKVSLAATTLLARIDRTIKMHAGTEEQATVEKSIGEAWTQVEELNAQAAELKEDGHLRVAIGYFFAGITLFASGAPLLVLALNTKSESAIPVVIIGGAAAVAVVNLLGRRRPSEAKFVDDVKTLTAIFDYFGKTPGIEKAVEARVTSLGEELLTQGNATGGRSG